MRKGKFDFIESYRSLFPNASREIVDLRKQSHDQLAADLNTIDKIYDLCRLAFQLEPHSPELNDWFERPIKALDPHFSLSQDKAEAGVIAALLLRERVCRSECCHTALAVLSASYCGMRHSADKGILLTNARDALMEAARNRRIPVLGNAISAPKFILVTAEFEQVAAQNPAQGPSVKTALEAINRAGEQAVTALAVSVDASRSSARSDTARLAEEVDMLWWYLGDWYECLDKPRSSMPPEIGILVSGIELGELVQQLPGPYGAYGLLRRVSGTLSDRKTTLRTIVESLSQVDARILSKPIPSSAKSLFPLHAAIQAFVERGSPEWESEFAKAVPDACNIEAGLVEIGVQVYRERMLINHDGPGQ